MGRFRPHSNIVEGCAEVFGGRESTGFATHAFPPTLSDTERHQDAWNTVDCMTCHEDGLADAPIIQHRGLPPRLLTAQCRSCHELIRGQTEDEVVIRQE